MEVAAHAPPKPLWEEPRPNPDVASPVVVEGKVYSLKGGILVSGDAKTGEVRGRLRLTGPFSSSIIAAGGVLYCVNEEALAQVVRLRNRSQADAERAAKAVQATYGKATPAEKAE
jgi:hypothetical protein